MRTIFRYVEYISRMGLFSIKFVIAYMILFFNKNKMTNEWIISERGDEARDNGYHLFKYIRKNYPDINVYYVISKDSVDLGKVQPYNNIIYYGTIEHYKALIRSTHLISTHLYGWAEYGKAAKYWIKLLPTKKIIHIKHGITYNKIDIKDEKFDLLTSVSEQEKEILTYNNTIKLPVKVTGFCRFDNLIDKSNEQEKIILVMPTFRSWLHDISRMANPKDLFIKEEYYKFYNELLNNQRILDLCRENNLKIYFYPHYRVQDYLSTFDISNERVILASKQNYDIQDLLNRSSILITDYSSIFFDFAYMKKPILYSQFDKHRFYSSHHYKESDFTIEDNGFGRVVESISEIEQKLEEVIRDNYKMEKKYEKRVDDFFKYRDDENCKRVLEEILLLK